MSGNGNGDDRGQADNVRGKLRQLASEIKGQIADVDRRAPLKRAAALVEDDPWDTASAEALTRLYEGDAPEPAQPAPLPKASLPPKAVPAAATPKPSQPIYFADPPVRSAGPTATAAPSLIQAVAAATAPASISLLAADRAWLDGRHADLHAKVEATLSSFGADSIVAPVTARVDRLEDHLMTAVGTLAQKADLERFAGLEADVASIKGHVETARDQLKRLDGIEANLKGLQALATDAATAAPVGDGDSAATSQRFDELEAMVRDLHTFAAEQAAPQAADPPDFHGLAAKAADRAAANVVEQYKDLFAPSKRAEMAQLAQANAGASLEDMQALLGAYQDEQRREASQTASALTTMQEALIRLIDRIEELAGEAPAPTEEAAESLQGQRFVEVENERSAAPGRRAADRTTPAQSISVEQALAVQQAQSAAAYAAAAPQAAPSGRAPRQPRVADSAAALAPQPPVTGDEDAAVAMAAERARVQAERAQGRRLASARPQLTVAPDPAEAAAEAAPERRKHGKAGADGQKAKMLAGLAAASLLLIGGSIYAYTQLGMRAGTAKLGDRIPAAAAPAKVVVPAPTQVQRPTEPPRAAIATETIEAAPPRAPTPALPEAQPSRDARPQPTAGQPLTAQPLPQDAPAPRVAPAPQTRTPDAAGPRRAAPETVTDELSANTDEVRPNFAEVMGARISTAAVQGIALDTAGLSPVQSGLAQRQVRMAAAEPAEPAAEAPARSKIELPPASIGPMSLRIAAQQGDPGAAFEVGARFAEAKGVKQDYQQALAWYNRAAQQGFGPAQYRLATIYEGGLHGAQDTGRAKVWYKRAADQGHVKAMHNLAVLAAGNGQGQPDYQTAARWFSEAADRGLADSQFNLGVLHESGLGVAKDPLQAYKWFALAARSGDKEALRRRDQVMAAMTPQAAQGAERLVTSWRAKPTDMKANDPRAASAAMQQARAQQMEQQQEQMQAAQLRQQQKEQQRQTQAAAVAAAETADAKAAARKPAAQRTTASTTPAPVAIPMIVPAPAPMR